MIKLTKAIIFLFLCLMIGCKDEPKTNGINQSKTTQSDTQKVRKSEKPPFIWEGSNIYFLLTDRFKNGDPTNDEAIKRTNETGKLRGFEGGDIKGIIQKIKDGYFKALGVNVIWFSPIVEQIHGSVDEGTGNTYAFHGYWTKDWTKIDPNFGTYKELKELIDTAHKNDIRILMDVVMNHTGPVTEQDPVWPDSWVRTSPQCTYKDYESTINCTLVKNLPDIKTENNENVELPEALINKWKAEGRLEIELAEIDVFFTKTRLKRSPKNYIIKWLTDYVRELGIDGYRVDTVKHIKEDAWSILAEQAKLAFLEWKSKNPDKTLDDNEFYMLGELYGYGIDGKRYYDFGDRRVDYFAHGFNNMINFQFKYDANQLDYEKLFSKYSKALYTNLIGKGITNYISSHDDGKPFDKKRNKTYESATKLLLTPGISQIYYGDEIARPLIVDETKGDATLRSNMNWDAIDNEDTKTLLQHWQKLGVFRKNHPAVGAGKHKMISQKPYVFSRKYHKNGVSDKVVIGLDLPMGEKIIKINSVFPEGAILIDEYSGKEVTVSNDSVMIDSEYEIALLAIKK
ncbi:alpha-amylase [Aquimarina sp. EL_43]|uniref:alpha-amylase family glycosyl hydrolase n=1 Tax=unclassified Aquimarina TaxID=2627091 RepID=UPI0018CA9FC6|nr:MULTISPECIES: alpha-amylase family glycosyl hydrolase [unclassified Aquimarina]MBG6129351.1 alpha-amylase [Aquimarina sp. EL_35]MBG6150416.1 alpha-amylase [Aquimarina sp. EL_32]MBG6168276.1 alpha-amylase [Aquimarina sp. EL_43]